MFAPLLATLTLALLCTSSPVLIRENPVKLTLARHFNFTGSAKIIEADQARARALKTRTHVPPAQFGAAANAASSGPLTNTAVTYTAEVLVGSPATTYNLIVDTGSSNTWVGADPSKPYVPTPPSEDTGEEVFVEYGSGLFIGEEWLDTISFAGITIPDQSIGASELAFGFNGVDGILGIGPTDLTQGTTSSGNLVPTVIDTAFTLNLIPNKQVGVSFEPTNTAGAVNGELTLGGADASKFTSALHSVPLTTTSPASLYFGVDQSVTYGGESILESTAGIVDTGTTLVLIASDAFARYQTATGGVSDADTGLLSITPAQFAALQNLDFNIGGQTFSLTPNAQIWPRALNTAIGGTADSIYLIVGDIGSNTGAGLDFINGYAFLERFYSVFDSGAGTVSFAETAFTGATSN
ncbi:acid protease [Trametopsis cervina]|nr:acid protease [Trametopsis cervina]